jgi:hypothetical protein
MKKIWTIGKSIYLIQFIVALTLITSAQETEGDKKEPVAGGETEHFGS